MILANATDKFNFQAEISLIYCQFESTEECRDITVCKYQVHLKLDELS